MYKKIRIKFLLGHIDQSSRLTLILKIFNDFQGVLDPDFVSYKELKFKGQ